MKPSRLRWGLLFVTVGVMLLLNNSGNLSWEYWLNLLSWWPLILIAIGIEKIFNNTSLKFISYLSPLLLVAGMVYVAYDTDRDDFGRGLFKTHRWELTADSGIEAVDVAIDQGRNDLAVRGGGSNYISARFDRLAGNPKIKSDRKGNVEKVEIKPRFRYLGGTIIIDGRHYRRDWTITLSDKVPYRLDCQGRGADMDLDFDDVQLEKLTIENDEADIDLSIGELSPRVELDITCDEGQLQIRYPEKAGLKISGVASSRHFENVGLRNSGDYYVTDNFDTAPIQITAKLSGDLNRFSLTAY
jgi:hypothetical protein